MKTAVGKGYFFWVRVVEKLYNWRKKILKANESVWIFFFSETVYICPVSTRKIKLKSTLVFFRWIFQIYRWSENASPDFAWKYCATAKFDPLPNKNE